MGDGGKGDRQGNRGQNLVHFYLREIEIGGSISRESRRRRRKLHQEAASEPFWCRPVEGSRQEMWLKLGGGGWRDRHAHGDAARALA